ncbi:MAG: TonB-dependent receptor [Acidobacteriia bacterium]|nr:TonB-dependent receptor [Terriglobia bacterium]
MMSRSTALILFSMVCGAGLWAQSAATSQISGTVTDPTGATVADAQVKLTQTDTGLVRTATSGADGSYSLLSLPTGPYKLEVTKQGFSTYVQAGIVLQVNSNPRIEAQLKVGAVSDQVVVEAATTMVEVHTTSVGQVIDSQRVVDLPLNGRNPTELIFLTGASAQAPNADLVSAKNYPSETPISIAGGAATGATYTLDGGTHNDPFNNLALPLPFPDALQEFKVETSALPAQYGQHSGGAVNAITKSGTNEIHGDFFEFVRNYKFNARNFFQPVRDSLKRNQFGGTVGGPIKKDKLFFFAGYQGTIIRSNPASANGTVPTPQMVQNGDFSTIASTTCQARGIQLYDPASSSVAANRLPYVGNQIPVSQFSTPAINMLKFYPKPDNSCGKEGFSTKSAQDEHTGVAKGDYQINSKQSAFLRYYVTHSLQPTPYDGVNPLSMTSSGADDLVNSAVFGHTWVVSPTMINAFRATFNRSAVTKTQTPTFDGPSLGIKMHTLVPGHIVISMTGGPSSAAITSYPAFDPTTGFQLANDFTVIKGKHQFAFGGSWIRTLQYVYGPLNGDGVINFNGQQTGGPLNATGLGMADFLLGRTNTFQQGGVQYAYERYHSLGLYAQDNWKLTPHLTLNYGLRWEPYIGGSMPLGYVMHFDRGLFDQNVHSSVYPNAPAGVLFPGDKGFDTNGRPSHTKMNDFAPRIGVVWDPKGNGRMTVRLSWGILYDMPHTLFAYGFSQAPPWAAVIGPLNNVSFADPWANYPGGDPFPLNLGKNAAFPTSGTYTSYPLDLKVPYLQQWNLSLQKQIGANWLVSASYLGNSTIHLWAEQAINAAVNIPGASTANTNARRVLTLANPAQGQFFGVIHQLDDGSTASYNAMLLSVQHRIASHFSVLANYTLSHCISGPFSSELDGAGYTNPGNRNYDRGNCVGIDHRHNANFSALQEAPRFSDKWMRALASDWRFSEIIRVQSGSFITVASGVDSALNGIGGQRANFIGGNPYANATCTASAQFCVPWLSPASFTTPVNGTYGNLGSANIQGPGSFQFDMSLVRSFAVRERQKVEIRAEAFNLLNHYRPGAPAASIGSLASFGQITAGGDPRIMQFAFKYIF